jgi:hypothetical protein
MRDLRFSRVHLQLWHSTTFEYKRPPKRPLLLYPLLTHPSHTLEISPQN